jgi:predicted nucleotide-binding protein
MVIRHVFGESSVYINEFRRIQFYVPWAPSTDVEDMEEWSSGRDKTLNLLNTMFEELELNAASAQIDVPAPSLEDVSNRVFVIHGHDDTMKLEVSRALEKLDLEPIILHEQENRGRTIIEKFEHFSDVGFAVALFSPDDAGYSTDEGPESYRYRARQNVIFELGYFIGKLGRERAVALHRRVDNFEMPSDYDGVLYRPFEEGKWQFDLVRELKACGYDIDANKLI